MSAAIVSTLERLKEQYKLDAVIAGVEQDGKPLVRTAIGTSSGIPATTDMHFRVGGVGWQYLVTVMLLMSEQNPGPIALTDRASKWYPAYPHADAATVRMLAASSAGFGDYINAPAFLQEVEADPLRVWTADELIVRSLPPYVQKPQFPNPGGDWAYSHTDFIMLGAILERAGGKPYAVMLRERVLEPLGLRDTRLQFDADPQQPVLQTREDERFRDSTYWNPSFVSWAALTSNICDAGTWNRAFGNGTLLSAGSKPEIAAPLTAGLGGTTPQGYFGLGTLVYPPWIVQRAGYWGMYTTTAYDTSTGISLAVTVSLSPSSPAGGKAANEIVTELSKLLTDHPVPK